MENLTDFHHVALAHSAGTSAVMFIEPRLCTPLTAEDESQAVGGSDCPPHRMFTDVYGASIMPDIRSLALTEDAQMLGSSTRDPLPITPKRLMVHTKPHPGVLTGTAEQAQAQRRWRAQAHRRRLGNESAGGEERTSFSGTGLPWTSA